MATEPFVFSPNNLIVQDFSPLTNTLTYILSQLKTQASKITHLEREQVSDKERIRQLEDNQRLLLAQQKQQQQNNGLSEKDLQRLDGLSNQLSKHDSSLSSLSSQLAALQAQVKTVQDKEQKLAAQAEQTQDEIEKIKQQLTVTKGENDRSLTTLQREIERVKETVREVQKEGKETIEKVCRQNFVRLVLPHCFFLPLLPFRNVRAYLFPYSIFYCLTLSIEFPNADWFCG